MSEDQIQSRILGHVKQDNYRPERPRKIAKALELSEDGNYPAFREALKSLMHAGRVVLGANGAITLPLTAPRQSHDHILGTYRHNKRGFGFVVPTDPSAHEDLFIPPEQNNGAMNGDTVRAKITSRSQRDGKTLYTGRVVEVVERKSKRLVGSLVKQHNEWLVFPDGTTVTEPIVTPDAASRHVKPGTKVVVEITRYAEDGDRAQGVITEVIGTAGEKDVDLKSIIVQHNLPESFPEPVRVQARQAVDSFVPDEEIAHRFDLTGEVICTIDPDDAKDYDDAISLRQVEHGHWELGVHIADVSFFVPEGSPLDLEARERGNSTYFPGFVIPMLPEILSNGVCSLQGGVPRLCKSAFITYDEHAQPIRTRFSNSVIKSAARLRYREAQALLDHASIVPHPDGDKRREDYPPEVLRLLDQMDTLAKRLQQRRRKQGQINLSLPEIDLVLDDEGKVVDAVPEDTSFTHTLIEMFMVEANEAVARLLNVVEVPFLRRTHPEPDMSDSDRLRQFVSVAGHKLPKEIDRHAIQALLASVDGKPESFAINLAILKSLTRAEYSPEPIGHYALASEHYAHFTSPIRRYADLTIHRLLDAYFAAVDADFSKGPVGPPKGARKQKPVMEGAPSFDDLVKLGKQISFTERRSEDAEKELRQVKLLTLLSNHIGDVYSGVITGITNFGVFVQLREWLVDGLIRYENLMDDWWDVDERGGTVRGQRTGVRLKIGDVCKVAVARVDIARRELDLQITELPPKAAGAPEQNQEQPFNPSDKSRRKTPKGRGQPPQIQSRRGGGPTGGSQQRGRGKPNHRGKRR